MAEEQKYRIIRKLDAGGMAEVFLADSESIKGFKRRVAIKRILPHLTQNRSFVQMFLDEARLSLQLQHANIVSVFDIGKADNTFFIVMDYIDGTNLKKIIEHTRKSGELIPMEQAIYIVREICEGLAYAHDQRDMETGEPLGIVHRDVSPPNILISNRGEIKLVDFGLAKATSQLETTDPGVVKGKFSYLSPESASGLEVDSRADIFSAAIILWELLTGRRLFYGENDYQTVELVRQANIPPISTFNAQVPRELEEILLRALARDADERYQSAPEFGEALTRYLFGHGMAVSRHDIAKLVRKTVSEEKAEKPRKKASSGGIIDALIQEEIVKFTSLDDLEDPLGVGAKPLSPEDISVAEPLDPGDFVDPRAWADDLDGEGLSDVLANPESLGEDALSLDMEAVHPSPNIDDIHLEVTAQEMPAAQPPEIPAAAAHSGAAVEMNPAGQAAPPQAVQEPAEQRHSTGPRPVARASHRMPSPAPKPEESSAASAVLWALLVIVLLGGAGAALWMLDVF
jgi:serine/threonine-protein kinase